ncbi:MAG TPA: hypothetical protein VMT68_10615 [Caulobacteraceae bacterium]|nr:hypothetical protein [Caulobacteraceae bacterium]
MPKFHSTKAIAIAAALAAAAAPTLAAAQPPGDYWQGDVCHWQRHAAARRGSFLGALFGGIFGAAVAGRGSRAAGAAIGGTAGAAIGHAVGRDSVQCEPYPPRFSYHEDNCRWVSEYYGDGRHEFEVCRDRDGVWRPSGRS